MTTFRTASATVLLSTLILVSGQSFEAKKKQILDSLALSIVNSLVEIDTTGAEQTFMPESTSPRVLVADSGDDSAARPKQETVEPLVLPLPPLKPLPKPLLCPTSTSIHLAAYRTDSVRQRFAFMNSPESRTEVRVVTSDSEHTGDWAKLIASCREKSLKVCIEKSRNRQRVVILDDDATQKPTQPEG